MVAITKVLFLALTANATILRRDAATVEVDINQKMGPQTATLNKDVDAFPASGFSGSLAVDRDMQDLSSTVNGATSDTKTSGTFSEADGTTILEDVQAYVSTFLATLSSIGAKEADWAALAGGKFLILSDPQGLNGSFNAFADALIASCPADLVPSATSVKTQLVYGFESAIAEYS